MNALPGYDNWLSAPYDNDVRGYLIADEVERINDDTDRQWDAVADYATKLGQSALVEQITASKLLLSRASWALDRIMDGSSWGVIEAKPRELQALRELVRAANQADKDVDQIIQIAAADAVDSQS